MIRTALLASLAALLIAATPARLHAQDNAVPAGDLMPPVTTSAASRLNDESHPALKMTPDKSELVHLNRKAASVVVGNPAHITVLLDTPTLAVVIPRAPGATYFTVLDEDGKVVMQRHVIVASPKKNYVRVRRSCGNAGPDANCRPTSVYFCPDMCHEIESGAQGAEPAAGIPEGR